jgi:hypothetical protein
MAYVAERHLQHRQPALVTILFLHRFEAAEFESRVSVGFMARDTAPHLFVCHVVNM